MSISKRTSISIQPKVLNKGLERVQALGYESFSEYLAFLIERDHLEHPDHVRVRSASKPTEARFLPDEPALVAEQAKHGYTAKKPEEKPKKKPSERDSDGDRKLRRAIASTSLRTSFYVITRK